MDEVSLMKRVDTKFVVNVNNIQDLFLAIRNYYKILEIDGNRLMTYDSAYFDTKNFKFYLDHHNKLAKRTKVRIRNYVESDLSFLEIKQKDSKGNTIKSRIQVDSFSNHISEEGRMFIENKTKDELALSHTLTNRFNRITLVSVVSKERVTFDFNLSYNNTTFNENMVIIELKQEKLNRESKVFEYLKSIGNHPYSISKYCIGMASLHQNLKQNYFKSKFIKINKLTA